MSDMVDMFVQKIIPSNITIFRAYSNAYYWLKNNYYDIETRNIGYYSPLQSELANNFKASVISWLSDANILNIITKDMLKNMGNQKKTDAKTIQEFINKLSADVSSMTRSITELLILSIINTIPIIIHNDASKIIYIFDNGMYYTDPEKKIIDKYDFTKCINIKYDFANTQNIPNSMDVIYYKDKV
jgi:hypothetical protein